MNLSRDNGPGGHCCGAAATASKRAAGLAGDRLDAAIARGAVEWSVHQPSAYIRRYWSSLLPDWSCPVQSVIVLLQQAPVPLQGQSGRVEGVKVLLRDRALVLGQGAAALLIQQGHSTAVFDPRTGLPVGTAPGKRLDDVALIQQLLGYGTARDGHCTGLLHPRWGKSVYPSTLLSSALPHQAAIIRATRSAQRFHDAR